MILGALRSWPVGGSWLVVGLLVLVCAAGCTTEETVDGPVLQRGKFFVNIEETLDGEPTEVNQSQGLVTRRLLHHGFELVESADKARYIVEGTVTCKFHKKATFDYPGTDSITLQYQYEGQMDCKLIDVESPGKDDDPHLTERFSFPEPLIDGRQDDEDAKRGIRRWVGTKLANSIAGGKLLGQAEIKALIDALGDPYESRSFDDIVDELKAVGYPAVPYLLEALDDDRPVRLKGTYPGLEEWNADSLRYFHVADKALEEILQRYSGLTVDSIQDHTYAAQLAWTWAWEELQQLPEEHRTDPNQRRKTFPAPRAGEALPEDLIPPALRDQ